MISLNLRSFLIKKLRKRKMMLDLGKSLRWYVLKRFSISIDHSELRYSACKQWLEVEAKCSKVQQMYQNWALGLDLKSFSVSRQRSVIQEWPIEVDSGFTNILFSRLRLSINILSLSTSTEVESVLKSQRNICFKVFFHIFAPVLFDDKGKWILVND